MQLKSEAQKLNRLRQGLSVKVSSFATRSETLQSENKQIPTLRADIDGFRQELVRARSAVSLLFFHCHFFTFLDNQNMNT